MSSSTYNLILLKSSLKNRDILLNSFKTEGPQIDRHVRTEIRFPARDAGARFHPSMLGFPRSGRQGALRIACRLHRLRLHRAVSARRLAGADHDAALAAGNGGQAGRADGRRHDDGRRPVGEGRKSQAHDGRRDRGEQGRHPQSVLPFHPLWRRQARCDHARQRGLAGQAQLHRFSPRRRAPFLGQPHAGDGFGQAQAHP